MIKAVVFDFDGVLGDTWDKSIEICREIGMDITLDDYKDHHNGNVYEKPKLKFSEEQAASFFQAYAERASADKLFPLSEELKTLSDKYQMFIISSNIELGINKYLSSGEWLGFFEKTYGYETDKSKVKKFGMLFKEYSLQPEECIFVTDTLGDLLEGEKVGVKTLAVTWGYHGEMRLKKGNPGKVIHDFEELSGAVEEMEVGF